MAKTATITYPDGLAHSLDLSDDELARELAFMAAAKLFELGRVTGGQAAQIAAMERLDFLRRLGETDVPAINLAGDEADAEIQAAKDLAG